MKIEGKSLLVFGSRTLNDSREGSEYRLIVTALDPAVKWIQSNVTEESNILAGKQEMKY